jgi:hypothetical protein
MEIVGKTTNGIELISGVGPLYYKNGLPLSVIFDGFIKTNKMPSWTHLYEELESNGIPEKRIIHLLSENIGDSYGSKFRDEVIKRLLIWLDKRNGESK